MHACVCVRVRRSVCVTSDIVGSNLRDMVVLYVYMHARVKSKHICIHTHRQPVISCTPVRECVCVHAYACIAHDVISSSLYLRVAFTCFYMYVDVCMRACMFVYLCVCVYGS